MGNKESKNKASKEKKTLIDFFGGENSSTDKLNKYAGYLILQLIEYANASGRIPFLDKNIQQAFKLIVIFNIEYELTRLRDLLFSDIITFNMMDLSNNDKLYEIAPIDNIETVFDISVIQDKLKFYIDNFHEFTIIPTEHEIYVIGSNEVSFNTNYKHGLVLARIFRVFNTNGIISLGTGANARVYKQMLIFDSNQNPLLLTDGMPHTYYYEYANKRINASTAIQNDRILLDTSIDINHPFIIKCFIENSSGYYLEFCYDPSKKDYFKFIKMSKFLIAQLVLVLHYLEQKQIVHYDLHLEQLLIGRDGFLRLSDFGASKTKNKCKGYEDQLNFFEMIIKKLVEEWGGQSGPDYDHFCSIIGKDPREKINNYFSLGLKYPNINTLIDMQAYQDIKNNYYLIDTFKKKYPDLDIEIFFDIFGINYQFSQLIGHPYLCDASDWEFLLEKERLYYIT